MPYLKRKMMGLGLICLLTVPIWYVFLSLSFGQSDETPPEIIEPEMILIEEGAFLRGTKETEKTPEINEMPQYSVFLSDFYIDKYEVTNAMYKKFTDATGHRLPRHWVDDEIPMNRENHPVIYVSWEDAVAYAEWAGKRLPTEAEWEKAARGTEGQNYPWGNEFDPLKCRSALSNIRNTAAVNEYENGMSPNGCYNMAGNVWEWVQDRYDWRYYKREPHPDNNPKGPDEAEAERFPNRVIRGGGWSDKPEDLRCIKRTCYPADYTSFKIGFRCAKDAE